MQEWRKEGTKKGVIKCANYTTSAVQGYLPSSPALDQHSQSRKINQTHYSEQPTGVKHISAVRTTGWGGRFLPQANRRVPVWMTQAPWHHPVSAHPKPGSISNCPTLSRIELPRFCIICLTGCCKCLSG